MDHLFIGVLACAYHWECHIRLRVSFLARSERSIICGYLADKMMHSMLLVFSGVFTFLVDAYPLYAASALAANSFARSSFAAAFPLFGNQSKFKAPSIAPPLCTLVQMTAAYGYSQCTTSSVGLSIAPIRAICLGNSNRVQDINGQRLCLRF